MRDFTLALACLVLLMAWKMQPWGAVIVSALSGIGLAPVG
jgi:chromate transporter